MTDKHYEMIKREYGQLKGDSTQLFQVIKQAAGESSLDNALALLEKCVIEKRSAWIKKQAETFPRSNDPVWDGYRFFYEAYLGVKTPDDGEIVERTDRKIVMRWWNACPTLEACKKLGLSTRDVCKKVYHQPVDVLLKSVHSKLRFERNYECIRPFAAYCEEFIILEE